MTSPPAEMCQVLWWTTLVALIFEGEGKITREQIFNQGEYFSHDTSGWYLLGMRGNATVGHQKPEVLTKELKHFVEIQTGISYHQITINSVSFTPNILVNFSINAISPRVAREPLQEHNSTIMPHHPSSHETIDTPLSLTSSQFNVTFFKSALEILHPKPVKESLSMSHEKKMSLIYVAVGAILVIIICVFIVAAIFFIAMKKDKKKKKMFSTSTGFGRFSDPTQTIYSDHINKDNPEIIRNENTYSGPIDDNLQPVELEMDFTPAYIKQEDQKSFVSDKSIGESCHLDLNLSSEEPDRVSTPSKSPFFESQYTSTPRPMSNVSCQSNPINNKRHSIPRKGKKPPPPPNRTDSLDPGSRVSLPSPNTHIEFRNTSSNQTPKVRRYSAPAPRPDIPLSYAYGRPTSSASQHATENSFLLQTPLGREVIEEEVQSILENLGVN